MTRVFVIAIAAALALAGCARMQDMMTKKPGASATVLPTKDSTVRGSVKFTQKDDHVIVSGRITGLAPGAHGFHIHEKGNCTAPDGSSAGPHFNPETMKHGGPTAGARHGGDLGNITADAGGVAEFTINAVGISLGADATSVVGRSVVVHAKPDDLKTDPSGGSGARLGCGLIGKSD
jgi:Cu-Zn family superoxide dismutase